MPRVPAAWQVEMAEFVEGDRQVQCLPRSDWFQVASLLLNEGLGLMAQGLAFVGQGLGFKAYCSGLRVWFAFNKLKQGV